jgi:hypothetical protein
MKEVVDTKGKNRLVTAVFCCEKSGTIPILKIQIGEKQNTNCKNYTCNHSSILDKRKYYIREEEELAASTIRSASAQNINFQKKAKYWKNIEQNKCKNVFLLRKIAYSQKKVQNETN